MPSNRSADRWGNAAVAGAAIAAGGAGMVMHGADRAAEGHRAAAAHRADLPGAHQGLEVASEKLSRYRSGLKVNRAMAGGTTPTAAERKVAEQPYKRAISHQKARISGHEKEITRAELKVAGAKRVKRVGSGVLGAGATLATLGAVMAERRRKQAPKISSRITTPHEAPPSNRPLKDYRSMVSTGGLLRDEQGKPKGLSPNAGRDWLRANKDRA